MTVIEVTFMDENSSSTKKTPFTLYRTHVFSSTIHNTEPKRRRQGVNECLMFLPACNTAKTIPTCVVSQIQSDKKQIPRKKNKYTVILNLPLCFVCLLQNTWFTSSCKILVCKSMRNG